MNTDPDLQQLRDIYQRLPAPPGIPLGDIRRGAARRRRRRRLAVAAGAIAAVAAVILVPLMLATLGSRPAPGPTIDPAREAPRSPNPSNSATPDAATMQTATTAVYRVLDADPDLGYYMLRTGTEQITLWGRFNTATVAAVRDALAATGVGLTVRPLPHDLDPYHLQSRADAAAEQMRALGGDADYGFTQLKLQLPLRGVIVWRVNPDATIDSALDDVARHAGLDLELRTATVSRAEAQDTATTLKTANDRWRQHGFQVLGCFARPSGVVVTVQGDTKAAANHLLGRGHVIAVLNGEPVYGTIN